MEPMVPVWLTRRARLENKRSRLEQWLQLILSRARKGGNRLLQSAIERFLSVADKFPDADSEALLALNSVTSLVVVSISQGFFPEENLLNPCMRIAKVFPE